MLIIVYIICFIIGLLIGKVINTNLSKNKCNHKWELFESGNIRRHGRHIGFFKVYECERCKKMKKEQIEIS
jgi:hypothetical protein